MWVPSRIRLIKINEFPQFMEKLGFWICLLAFYPQWYVHIHLHYCYSNENVNYRINSDQYRADHLEVKVLDHLENETPLEMEKKFCDQLIRNIITLETTLNHFHFDFSIIRTIWTYQLNHYSLESLFHYHYKIHWIRATWIDHNTYSPLNLSELVTEIYVIAILRY